MADSLQSTSHFIPVIDERIVCPTNAPKEHKARVAEYNELLEVIYQREVELGGIKSTLIDMREMIAQEARIIEAGGTIAATTIPQNVSSVKSDSESDIDAEHVLSDSSSEPTTKGGVAPFVKKVAKKNKKPKGSRRSKLPDAQLDGDWDFKLDLAIHGAMNRGRRESDEEESEEDDSPEVALV